MTNLGKFIVIGNLCYQISISMEYYGWGPTQFLYNDVFKCNMIYIAAAAVPITGLNQIELKKIDRIKSNAI